MNDDLHNKLERLANLKEQGVLTEAEFDVHKARLLQSKDATEPEARRPIIRQPAFWVAIVVVIALYIYFVRQPSDEDKRQAAILKAQMMLDRMAEQADQKKASDRNHHDTLKQKSNN